MDKKRIAIIGGGISGLSLLHYLSEKSAERSVDVVLFEKNSSCGGTIATERRNDCLLELGPNGFLDNGERTLQLIKEISLENTLVKADHASARRFISVSDELFELPSNPKDFFKFKPLSLAGKVRAFGEFFIGRGQNGFETVYEFGRRRFGSEFTELFLDPMVSGIFGGDPKSLNFKLAFPRIYDMEQRNGSLARTMVQTQKDRAAGKPVKDSLRGQLTSFKGGMGTLIEALQNKYSDKIKTGKQVVSLAYEKNQYRITLEDRTETADEVYLCAPAYAAQRIVKEMWPQLSKDLGKIPYAPMAVVNLVYWKELFDVPASGFGYLIPSKEKKEVLGVLFESNVFPDRAPDDKCVFRVMIGGARHPEALKLSEHQLIQIAKNEISAVFKVKGDPQHVFVKVWDKAIPQYDKNYSEALIAIKDKMTSPKNFHLLANYLGGVSVNDCINNAYRAAQNSYVV